MALRLQGQLGGALFHRFCKAVELIGVVELAWKSDLRVFYSRGKLIVDIATVGAVGYAAFLALSSLIFSLGVADLELVVTPRCQRVIDPVTRGCLATH